MSQSRIAAEDYLAALAAQGIDHLFVNPGTDFAPIIEAFARNEKSNRPMPKPMVVPHENAAVGMAHGHYMVSGRPQAVMVHVGLGTANGINCLINASRQHVPILFTAGRTPITESGPSGTRNRHIHWAQEMFDQAGMVREFVKWDYELRRGDQVVDVVDRAMELATASPAGPVYLTLPREVLGETVPPGSSNPDRPHRARASTPHPAPHEIERLAEWIAAAKMPLVITGESGKRPEECTALARLAERFALPVVSFNPRYLCFPTNHPMNLGYQPGPMLAEADLVIVLDTDVPWFPTETKPKDGAKVVQVGEDALWARIPMRSFPSDLTINAGTLATLAALERALEARVAVESPAIAGRRKALTERSTKLKAQWAAEAEKAGKAEKIGMVWMNHCLREVVDSDSIVISEYSFRQEYCPLDRPGSLFGVGSAGGLGWGFPAALGAKLAARDKLVVAVLGDGAYMFANPTACHWTAAAHDLPVLVVLFNNAIYGAVRRSTLDMFGKGAAAQDDGRLLAELSPSPAFEKILEAHGGHGERVERPADLPAALKRAAAAVKRGQQAVVNVICPA